MKVKFKLLVEKTDTDGLAPVFLFSYVAGKELKYFTKKKAKQQDWDSKKMRIKRSQSNFANTNLYLDHLENKLLNAYTNLLQQGIKPSISELKKVIELSET